MVYILNTVHNYNIVTMKVIQKTQQQETPIVSIRKKNHQHTDIFNTKDAAHLVIRNDEPFQVENIFQKNIDNAYQKVEGAYKRPSSSYNKSNLTYQEGSYAFNQDWSSANQFSTKTLVNESATFQQDYHQMRRFQQNSSTIFPSEDKKSHGMYKKNIQIPLQRTNHPNQSEVFGRRNILKQELDKLNFQQKKYSHNYSNLFGLGQRIQKIKPKQQNQNVQIPTLIPNGLSWQQYDSVLQNGSKDQEVGEDYHRKRNLQNMKSSLDTHKPYQAHNPQKRIDEPVDEIIQIVDKYGHLLGKHQIGNQNYQKIANQQEHQIVQAPKTGLVNKKKQQRPNSAVKSKTPRSNQVQIVITKGLTSKFNLNTLCQQCRLHSLVLSQYNNTVAGEKGTGRGIIRVIPQKKFGVDVLCSWLRSQGLSILVKGVS